MKIIIYVLLGVFIGLLASSLLSQSILNFFFNDESKLIDKKIEYHNDDDDDDDEVNRLVYYNNKLAIRLSTDEIKASGITVSKLVKEKTLINEEINAISLDYKNLLDIVNKYDQLNIQLNKSKINKEHNKNIYLRLKSLYENQGSIALKELEEVEFTIELIEAEVNLIKKDMSFLISELK